MIAYSVEVNKDQLADALSLFEHLGGNVPDAFRLAINKTLPIAKTRTAQAVYNEVNLKSAEIKRKILTLKASRQKLRGSLYLETRGLQLSKFEYGAKVALVGGLLTPEDPIRVKVKRGKGQIKPVEGKPETVGKPFLFRLKNSSSDSDAPKYGIGGWRKTAGPKGGRIEAFFGPSVSQVFGNIKEEARPDLTDVYQAQLVDQMRYLLLKEFPR